ncbi:MAG TPA: universal stress protein [Polyangiaceae bacterium]|jgi:universal stress protein A|nr:universal stress protein [Polyangiaceae bacterium]
MATTPVKIMVCPVDFSAPSEAGLDQAIAWAHAIGARLHVVHVFQTLAFVLPMSGYIGPQADLLLRMRDRCETELKRAVERAVAAGVPADYELMEGVPDQEIVGCAQRLKADAIVIGTHGHSGLAHVLLGSVAERVVRHADCPVLIVRTSHRALVRTPSK